MADCDCGDCNIDCLGDCCDGDCFDGCCCDDTDCNVCCCFYSTTTTTTDRRHRSTAGSGSCCCCCCRVVAALAGIAVAAAVVFLVLSYAVVFPARVTVEDADFRRFALTNGSTALAYDVSLDVALRNRDFAGGGPPVRAELRFRGRTFARAAARLESAESGILRSRGKGEYRVTMASSSAAGGGGVVLGGDAVAEFVRESVAGVFELELAVVAGEGHHHGRDVSVTCPLKLSLPTAAAAAAFKTVKCT